MTHPTQSYVRNCLLSVLSAADYAAMQPDLEPVTFARGDVLIRRDRPVDHVHFPNRGVGSVITESRDYGRVESGLFGREGMSGICVVLGVDETPQQTVMQIAGDGYRMATGALRAAMARSPDLHGLLLRYVQTMMTQGSFTALSNVNQPVEQRLARWLLMCHDRLDDDAVAITHEYLAVMLAVHRPSVTTALHVIEGAGWIRSQRGRITIRDRAALIGAAGGAYGVPEAEYRTLVGVLPRAV